MYMKEASCSNKLTDNYSLTLQLPSALHFIVFELVVLIFLPTALM